MEGEATSTKLCSDRHTLTVALTYNTDKDGAVVSPGGLSPRPARLLRELRGGCRAGPGIEPWVPNTDLGLQHMYAVSCVLSPIIFKNCFKYTKRTLLEQLINSFPPNKRSFCCSCMAETRTQFAVIYTPSITKLSGITLQPWFSEPAPVSSAH